MCYSPPYRALSTRTHSAVPRHTKTFVSFIPKSPRAQLSASLRHPILLFLPGFNSVSPATDATRVTYLSETKRSESDRHLWPLYIGETYADNYCRPKVEWKRVKLQNSQNATRRQGHIGQTERSSSCLMSSSNSHWYFIYRVQNVLLYLAPDVQGSHNINADLTSPSAPRSILEQATDRVF